MASTQAPATPITAPLATVQANTPQPPLPWPSISASSTSTASSAPIGSMMMPSQRRMLEMRSLGRTARSIGMITVGPVTQVSAPNSSATGQARSAR